LPTNSRLRSTRHRIFRLQITHDRDTFSVRRIISITTGSGRRARTRGTRSAGTTAATVGRRPTGDRGQVVGGQNGGRTKTGPGPGGARQDQPGGAGTGAEIATDRGRRVGPGEHGAGRGRETAQPDRRRRVFQGQGFCRRRRQTGTVGHAYPLISVFPLPYSVVHPRYTHNGNVHVYIEI